MDYFGGLAQLARALARQARGRWFEPNTPHQNQSTGKLDYVQLLFASLGEKIREEKKCYEKNQTSHCRYDRYFIPAVFIHHRICVWTK